MPFDFAVVTGNLKCGAVCVSRVACASAVLLASTPRASCLTGGGQAAGSGRVAIGRVLPRFYADWAAAMDDSLLR